MALRLASGPMLEKSNKIGLLADRQKLLLTARLRVSVFLGFSTAQETVNFQKISRELREILGNPKIFGISRIREIPKKFRGKFFRA